MADAHDDLPLPTKPRPKPQARGNIGSGKPYVDLAAFAADLAAWNSDAGIVI